MSSVLRSNPQTVVQGGEMGLGGSQQALGKVNGCLSTPQGQQEGLGGCKSFDLKVTPEDFSIVHKM